MQLVMESSVTMTTNGVTDDHDQIVQECGPGDAEADALSNQLILLKICSSLSPSTVKNLRLVSPTWNHAATFDLLRRDCFEIRIGYIKHFQQIGAYHRLNRNGRKGQPYLERNFGPPLDDLNSLILPKSGKIPIKTLNFDGDIIFSPCLEKFLCEFGPSIKNLNWTFQPAARLENQKPCERVMGMVQNVEKLTIHSTDNYFLDRRLPPTTDQICDHLTSSTSQIFPALKTFVLPSCPSFTELVGFVLESAPKLSTLDNVTTPYFGVILDKGKVNLVREVKNFGSILKASVLDHQKFVQALTQSSSQIREICQQVSSSTDKMQLAQLTQDFQQLVNCSKNYLEELHINNYPPMKDFNFKLDGFNFLREMTLCQLDAYLYLTRVNVKNQFPSLHFLHMDDAKYWPKKEKLEIGNQGYSDQISMQGLWGMMPKLKSLNVTWRLNMNHEVGEIFRLWPDTLESLKLSFFPGKVSNYPKLDSVLIGMNKRTCRSLRHLRKTAVGERILDFEKFRKRPWIGSMKALKSFKIMFRNIDDWNPNNRCNSSPSPLTSISGLYGLELTPNIIDFKIGLHSRYWYHFEQHQIGKDLKKTLKDRMEPWAKIVCYDYEFRKIVTPGGSK